MLKIGEYTMYSWYGACKVEDVREISKEDGKKMYYIFKPHNDKKATVMVPVDNERMRHKKSSSVIKNPFVKKRRSERCKRKDEYER